LGKERIKKEISLKKGNFQKKGIQKKISTEKNSEKKE